MKTYTNQIEALETRSLLAASIPIGVELVEYCTEPNNSQDPLCQVLETYQSIVKKSQQDCAKECGDDLDCYDVNCAALSEDDTVNPEGMAYKLVATTETLKATAKAEADELREKVKSVHESLINDKNLELIQKNLERDENARKVNEAQEAVLDLINSINEITNEHLDLASEGIKEIIFFAQQKAIDKDSMDNAHEYLKQANPQYQEILAKIKATEEDNRNIIQKKQRYESFKSRVEAMRSNIEAKLQSLNK